MLYEDSSIQNEIIEVLFSAFSTPIGSEASHLTLSHKIWIEDISLEAETNYHCSTSLCLGLRHTEQKT